MNVYKTRTDKLGLGALLDIQATRKLAVRLLLIQIGFHAFPIGAMNGSRRIPMALNERTNVLRRTTYREKTAMIYRVGCVFVGIGKFW